jgi:hypothetical protein
MNARVQHPVTRECPYCHQHKPLNATNFERRKVEGEPGEMTYRHQCRECRYKQKREQISSAKTKRCTAGHRYLALPGFAPGDGRCHDCRAEKGLFRGANPTRQRPLIGEPAYEPGPKPCVACCSLPWRVVGSTCNVCQLEHAEEPRVELVFRRFDKGAMW